MSEGESGLENTLESDCFKNNVQLYADNEKKMHLQVCLLQLNLYLN
jgi:hypothetical protein